MSVLTKNELIDLANSKGLLGSDFKIENFEPSSYDLRIGTIFKGENIYSENFKPTGFTNAIEIRPSEIVTLLTMEEVCLPDDCIGTVFAINSLSSSGLLILNPGHIDPGFKGPISICAINLSNQTKILSLGQRIFTIIIQKTTRKLELNEKYNGNLNLTRKEREEKFFRENSKKLSASFFDLINQDAPFFSSKLEAIVETEVEKKRRILEEKYDKKFNRSMAITAIIVTILTVGLPLIWSKNNGNDNAIPMTVINKVDSLQKLTIQLQQSIKSQIEINVKSTTIKTDTIQKKNKNGKK